MRSVELSIKEILVYILYRWVSVLLIVCLFAALFGGYAFIQQPRGEALKQALAEYESKLAVAKEQASIEIENLNARKRLNEQSISVLESVKGSGKAVTTLSTLIVYDPINVDPYRVSDKYISYFKEIALVDALGTDISIGLDENTLRSLVSIKVITLDLLPKQIDIQVLASNNFDSEVVARKLYDYFVNSGSILASAGSHTLELKSVSTLRDEDANPFYSAAKSLQTKAISLLNDQISTANRGIKDIQRQKPGFSLAVFEPMGLGAVIGLITGLIYLAFIYVYRIYVILPEQIQNRLNIQYLGGIRRIRFPGLGNIIAGSYLLSSTAGKAFKYINANVSNLVGPEKTILVTGSLPLDILSQCASNMEQMSSLKVLVSGDITKTAETFELLPEVDYVVLVERIKKSTMKHVNQQLFRFEKSGLSVIGYILF